MSSTDVFAVIIEDRHTDVEVILYHDREKAIAYARSVAELGVEDCEINALTHR